MATRQLVLRGVDFEAHFELRTLSPAMDAAYDRMFAEAFAGSIDWSKFRMATHVFIATTPTWKTMDHFFENTTPLWENLVKTGRYEVADTLWSEVVGAVVLAEDAHDTKVHKGAGYFFWAMNQFLRKDDERGLLLAHEALAEDRRTHVVQWPSAPAASLVQLDFYGAGVAAWWVADQINEIDIALIETGIGTEDIRRRVFLRTVPEHVVLFVHSHAALLRLERMPADHRNSDFVNRLALGHLFHIAVVVENLLKARTGVAGLFKMQAEALSLKVGGRMHETFGSGSATRGKEINAQANGDADGLLRRLLASTAVYGGVPVAAADRDICIGYVLRNLGGHSIAGPAVISEELKALRQAMVRLLGCITTSYY